MSSRSLVSVIIPNWNGAHLLGACLDSLRRQTYDPMEVIVVDGGSRDASCALIATRYREVRVVPLARNLGFAGNVNAGLRAARGDFLALLNNDAEADPEWIGQLVDALQADARIGSCASKLLHAADRRTIASAGDLLGWDGLAAQRGNGEVDQGQFDELSDVFAASGGAALYRRAMLADVGLFDEQYFSYLEDVDLGLRARLRGWSCRFVPTARVYHQVSATGGGTMASYFVGRNSIRLIARGFPRGALRACLPAIVRAQIRRAVDAAGAWRGAEARATLRGQAAGLANLPDALRSRRWIQARRSISDSDFLRLLVAPGASHARCAAGSSTNASADRTRRVQPREGAGMPPA